MMGVRHVIDHRQFAKDLALAELGNDDPALVDIAIDFNQPAFDQKGPFARCASL